MKSITIRNCTKFNVTDSLAITKGGEMIGNIASDNRSIIVEKNSFQVYSCSFFATLRDTIMVHDIESGEYQTFEEYKKSIQFKVYYSSEKNLLFVEVPTSVAKKFLKALTEQHSDKISLTHYDIDFEKVGTFQNTAKGIYFNVDDEEVDNKIFFGTGVDQNIEASQAIDTQQATYLLAQIDLMGRERTIGFSKKGALVIYNTPTDLSIENPYIELAYSTVIKLDNL